MPSYQGIWTEADLDIIFKEREKNESSSDTDDSERVPSPNAEIIASTRLFSKKKFNRIQKNDNFYKKMCRSEQSTNFPSAYSPPSRTLRLHTEDSPFSWCGLQKYHLEEYREAYLNSQKTDKRLTFWRRHWSDFQKNYKFPSKKLKVLVTIFIALMMKS